MCVCEKRMWTICVLNGPLVAARYHTVVRQSVLGWHGVLTEADSKTA